MTCLQSVKVIPGDEVAISRFLRSTSAAMLVEAEAAAEHVCDTPVDCLNYITKCCNAQLAMSQTQCPEFLQR